MRSKKWTIEYIYLLKWQILPVFQISFGFVYFPFRKSWNIVISWVSLVETAMFVCIYVGICRNHAELPHFLNNWAKLSLVVSKQQGALLKVWLIYSCNLATLHGMLFDSPECFELVIRKNSRSCTHRNYMMLLLISNVYKTFYFCGSLIPSIQCC